MPLQAVPGERKVWFRGGWQSRSPPPLPPHRRLPDVHTPARQRAGGAAGRAVRGRVRGSAVAPLGPGEAPDKISPQPRWLRAGRNAQPWRASVAPSTAAFLRPPSVPPSPRRLRYLNKKKERAPPRQPGSAAPAFRGRAGGMRRVCRRSPSPAGATKPCLPPHPRPPPPAGTQTSAPGPVRGEKRGPGSGQGDRRPAPGCPSLPGCPGKGCPGGPAARRLLLGLKAGLRTAACSYSIHTYHACIHRHLRCRRDAGLPVCPSIRTRVCLGVYTHTDLFLSRHAGVTAVLFSHGFRDRSAGRKALPLLHGRPREPGL